MQDILTMVGPRGSKVICDVRQVFPADPGRGTPSMLYWKGYSGTFACCINEGMVDTYPLPESIREWLLDIQDIVIDWEIHAFDKIRSLDNK